MRPRTPLLAVLALLSVPLAAARGGMPEPLTERGRLIEGIYYPVFIAAVVAFLIVMVLLIIVMVRFRAKGGSGRQTFEMERDNLKLEMAWIAIPLVVVLWVGALGYAGLVELDEGIQEEEAWMELKVTGYQWTWLADYGSGIQVFSDPDPNTGEVPEANTFVVPADVPIRFNVTGGDVIHAFHIMDDNWATVGLVDANPYGPHKYTSITAVLPEGDYKVQCREMCFNPGHGYMRATIQAVPMDEFQSWIETQRLAVGASLTQPVSLSWDGAGFGLDEGLTFVGGEGSRAIFTVENTASDDLDISVNGLQLLGTTYTVGDDGPVVGLVPVDEVTIAAGHTAAFAMETETFGLSSLEADGTSTTIEILEAEVVRVELGDFFIRPMDITLDAGTTYLFQIVNIGGTTHNLFINDQIVGTPEESRWASATIGGGATTSLVLTPDVAMKFTTWCNVPGHADLGMVGTLTAA